MSNPAFNAIEIRVVGLMRSGNHAVIDWIKSIYPKKKICFLNNIKHGDKNPFNAYSQKELINFEESSPPKKWESEDKDVLIYSYEDRPSMYKKGENIMNVVSNEKFDSNRVKYLGVSKNFFTILVVRDPYNCLASRMQMHITQGNMSGPSDFGLVKENWKLLAQKALAVENGYGEPGEIVLSYNKWLTDVGYRSRIATLLLGLESGEKLPQKTATYGLGSSFGHSPSRFTVRKILNIFTHSKKFQIYMKRFFSKNSVSSTNVFNRWEEFCHNDQYKMLLRDAELISLSDEIFGEFPGIQKMIDKAGVKPRSF